MQADRTNRDLEGAIQGAIADPSAANLYQLLQGLEQWLAGLPQEAQLPIAGTVLAQLVEIYVARAERLLDDWEEKHNPIQAEPILTPELLHEVLRQTMTLNLEAVLAEPPAWQQQPLQGESIAEILEPSQLLAFLAQLDQEHAKQEALAIAHDEDISGWITAIAHWLQTHPRPAVSLLELQRSLQMPFIEIWLALLLGGYAIEQRGDFYQIEGVWILP